MKIIKNKIAVKEKCVHSLTNDTMNQVNIASVINKFRSLLTLMSHVWRKYENSGIYDMFIFYCSQDLSIQKQKDSQSRTMLAMTTRNIDNLTLTLQKRIKTELSEVRGCSLLPDGRMVFSCNEQNKIRVFKSDESLDFEIQEIGSLYDVVFIGDDSIAVTSDLSETIYMYDLKKHKLTKSIKVKSYTGGAVYKDGHLIYCAWGNGLQMISLSDESITNVYNDHDLSHLSYVTTFGDKLFFTNYDCLNLTCCDKHGKILWTFCDTSVLLGPLGISVDSDGNVFVAGLKSDNLVVFTPDGQRYRELLSYGKGLGGPSVLHYDQLNDKLLVVNMRGEAFLYDVIF